MAKLIFIEFSTQEKVFNFSFNFSVHTMRTFVIGRQTFLLFHFTLNSHHYHFFSPPHSTSSPSRRYTQQKSKRKTFIFIHHRSKLSRVHPCVACSVEKYEKKQQQVVVDCVYLFELTGKGLEKKFAKIKVDILNFIQLGKLLQRPDNMALPVCTRFSDNYDLKEELGK